MASIPASSLLVEVNELLNALTAVRDSDQFSNSLDLTDDEQQIVIRLGKRLAEYHKYGPVEFHQLAFEDREEFIAWIKDNPPHAELDELDLLTRLLFIDIVYQCFERNEYGKHGFRKEGWRTAHRAYTTAIQGAYTTAIQYDVADHVFEAFTRDKLPNSLPTLQWPPEAFLHSPLHDVRRHRITVAVQRLDEEVQQQSAESPLINFYLDLSMQARRLISPGNNLDKHRVDFEVNYDALCNYKNFLNLCNPSSNVELDASGRLRVAKVASGVSAEFSENNIPLLNTQDGSWIRVDSSEMKQLCNATTSALSTSRNRGLRWPKGCEGNGCVCGREQKRIWRRDPDQEKVVWYLRESVRKTQ